MIDTCNFWIDKAVMGTGDPFTIAACLSDVEERQSDQRGYTCKGKLGDYTATINQAGVYLCGSLAKYYLPSNVYTLTRATIKEALEKMSDQLGVDMNAARPTRVDISTIIPTKRPPADYYSGLGNKPRFERKEWGKNTLYYTTAKRQLIFYDKTKEATAKNAAIPPTLEGCNLLRYELRFTNRLQQQFEQPDPITAAILYNPYFYCWLIRSWQSEFKAIHKIKTISAMTKTIKTTNDAFNALIAYALQVAGGQNLTSDFIADLKAQNTFADPKYYTRLKKKLNTTLSSPTAIAQSDLISELEQAVNDIAKYAR